MKKEYIRPMALAKQIESEQMLAGSEILKIYEDLSGGEGSLQDKEATGPGLGKQGIWMYLED